jgi:uncharacterized protein (TIGR00251 family)
MTLIETRDGLVLEVFVKPKSRKFKIIVEEDKIVVHCQEEPVKGKVNKELVKEFSKLFHCKVELISGFTSKQKKLLLQEIEKNKVEHLLSQLSSGI